MNRENEIRPVGFWPLFVLAMLVNIVSQTIHETGHHMVHQVMGRIEIQAGIGEINLELGE